MCRNMAANRPRTAATDMGQMFLELPQVAHMKIAQEALIANVSDAFEESRTLWNDNFEDLTGIQFVTIIQPGEEYDDKVRLRGRRAGD